MSPRRIGVTLSALAALWRPALAQPAYDPGFECTRVGIGRVINYFTATGSGDHVVLEWQASLFDDGTLFDVWRSIDGGVTFDSCATNQSGQCLTATFTLPGGYTLLDYGVNKNFLYSYTIRDSESGGFWYMAYPFQGSLTKSAPPNPSTAPTFTLSDLWTDGSTAKVNLNLALTGSPPHGTLWAHSYTVSYYRDDNLLEQTVTVTQRGTRTIALGEDPLPPLLPSRNYHIKIRGNGMSANTPYSAERHVRIMPAPDLYHAAVLAGTSISLQWWAADDAATAEYDIFYQRVSPEPPGNVVVVNAGTARVWNLSGLAEQSTYSIYVRARDAWDNPSPASPPRLLTTGVSQPTDVAILPKVFRLQFYPVPFHATGGPANLTFSLPQGGPAELVIYDVRGQLVRRVFRETKTAGTYVMAWDGRDDRGYAVARGIYVAQLRTGEKDLKQKFVLMR